MKSILSIKIKETESYNFYELWIAQRYIDTYKWSELLSVLIEEIKKAKGFTI